MIKIPEEKFQQHYILAENIEFIKAEYLNKDYIIEPVYYNYRVNNRGNRFYARLYPDNQIIVAPSYSAIRDYCSPMPYYLLDWYVKNGWKYCRWYLEHSANYGTFYHVLCQRILYGDTILSGRIEEDMKIFFEKENLDYEGCQGWAKEEKRDLRKDLFGFISWTKDYKVKPLAIEYPLMEAEGKWAGTLDIACKLTEPLSKKDIKEGLQEKEITALVDNKSGIKGFYEDHEIQLRAYLTAWNQEFQNLPAEKVFNLGCHDFDLPLSERVTPYKFKDQTNSENAYKWPLWVEIFRGNLKNLNITPITDFKEEISFSLETKTEELFETINPIDFLREASF